MSDAEMTDYDDTTDYSDGSDTDQAPSDAGDSEESETDQVRSDIPGTSDYQISDLAFRPFVEQRPSILGVEEQEQEEDNPVSYFLVITANPRTGFTLSNHQQSLLPKVVTAALQCVSQDRLFSDWRALLDGLADRTSSGLQQRQFDAFIETVSEQIMSSKPFADTNTAYDIMDTNEIGPEEKLDDYVNEEEVVCRRDITGVEVATTLTIQ
ncbi:hypothetical protein EHS25_008421 [Saitozyma podzolica]|uniref:Uncharacterized protein n=1 Tax=Saitozyma podzolica TaxID=1890683 RepID=A0A427YPF3_9TREE|nr:hypothetical protein EHS25_008421 [Saitozyma podzolica]